MDCKLHVTVSPYNPRIIPAEVKAVETFTASSLKRCQWPINDNNGRAAEGGCGGEIVAEQIVISWCNDKLIFPISLNAKPLAEKKNNGREIVYLAAFLAQLDGQVAYVPRTEPNDKNTGSAFIILIENLLAEIHAIRFSVTQSVIIDPYVKHSMPIPIDGTLEFNVWHRAINAVAQLSADPAGIKPIVINLCKVDRSTPIEISYIKKAKRDLVTLSHSFAKELLPLEESNPNLIAIYGQYIYDPSLHQEQVAEVPWPGSDGTDGVAGTLIQEFLVAWQPKSNSSHGSLELEFEGLSGSFKGEKGRPGVVYNPELGIYKTNLLMARPDGSFFTHPVDTKESFAMALALPNPINGNPMEKTLRTFIFRNGAGVRLEPCVWHSVPIPIVNYTTPVVFREYVAATNANLVIDLPKEVGHSIQFAQSV